jgi:hypothetical protein
MASVDSQIESANKVIVKAISVKWTPISGQGAKLVVME